jgi:Na+/H+ antiporter NhaD/arsenite permease-like protein
VNSEHHVSMGVTLFFAMLLVGMILALAFEEKLHIKKSLITGLAAALVLPLADVFGILPLGPLENIFHEKLNLPVYVTGVDWEVIAIILGSSLFVDVVSRSGLFTWVALTLTKRSGGDPYKLLWSYGILTVCFSAFLNNVTAIIIIGSLSVVSLERLGQQRLLLGFLMVEGLLTNVGGLLTLISSVPNIIAGNLAGISFVSFFVVAAPYVVVASYATIAMGAWLFNVEKIKTEELKEIARQKVEAFDETDGIESKSFFLVSCISSVLLVVLFATTSYLPILKDLGLGFVAVSFALVMLLAYKNQVNKFYTALDWDLLGFFVFLFVVINVMEHAKVLELLGEGLQWMIGFGDLAGKVALLWGSALASSVTDNIPLTAVLAKILVGFNPPTPSDSPLWWSVIFGANLGGNITPIGSASTLVAVAIIQKNRIELSFVEFVKKAVPFAAFQLVLATIYILVFV